MAAIFLVASALCAFVFLVLSPVLGACGFSPNTSPTEASCVATRRLCPPGFSMRVRRRVPPRRSGRSCGGGFFRCAAVDACTGRSCVYTRMRRDHERRRRQHEHRLPASGRGAACRWVSTASADRAHGDSTSCGERLLRRGPCASPAYRRPSAGHTPARCAARAARATRARVGRAARACARTGAAPGTTCHSPPKLHHLRRAARCRVRGMRPRARRWMLGEGRLHLAALAPKCVGGQALRRRAENACATPMSCPTSCCSNNLCQSPGLGSCGYEGGTCTACVPESADNCSGKGVCSCGADASCGPNLRCASSRCVCDAISCPDGCCAGMTCTPFSINSCTAAGTALHGVPRRLGGRMHVRQLHVRRGRRVRRGNAVLERNVLVRRGLVPDRLLLEQPVPGG